MSEYLPSHRTQGDLFRDSSQPQNPYGGQNESGPDGNAVHLRDIIEIFRRRIWIVLFCTLAGGAGAWYWAGQQEPIFRASATIRIVDPEAGLAPGLLQGAEAAGIQSRLGLLRTRAVLGEIVDQEGLRLFSQTPGFTVGDLASVYVPEEFPVDTLSFRFSSNGMVEVHGPTGVGRGYVGDTINVGGLLLSVPRVPRVEEAVFTVQPHQRAVESLMSAIVTRQRPGTDMVDVEFSSTNRDLAMRVVNSTIRIFQERNQEEARAETIRRRIFIEEQLRVAEAELEAAEQDLMNFQTREQLYSSQDLFASQQRDLIALDSRIRQERASRDNFMALLAGVENAETGGGIGNIEVLIASPQISGNPTVGVLFRDLLNLEGQRTTLIAGGAAPTSTGLQRVEEQIRDYRTRLYNAIGTELQAQEVAIRVLEEQREALSADIELSPETEVEQSRLAQRVQDIRGNANNFRDLLFTALLSAAVEEGPVRIVDEALRPLSAEGRAGKMMLALGLMLGLVVGGGAAFLAESLNTKIRRRDEMETLLRVPSVGIVPRLPGGNATFLRSGTIGKVRGLLGGNGKNGKRNRLDEELVTISDARSPHAEAYRTIRTNLLYSEAVTTLKTLVVTSPTPGEGKSTTASNLAVAYAQQGMKVLLIDCDLRKARLHHLFGLPRQPGITELVMGKVTWEEVVHDGPTEGLQVVTSGAHPPNPSELVGGARMRKALDLFRDHFDLVILDTPPLIAGPDAAILGSYCDGVVLVVRAGQTEKEAGQQAVRQLHTVGARILGAVLNDPDGELPKYSSYYAYQYKYYYGSEEED